MQQLEEDRIQCLKEIWTESSSLETATLATAQKDIEELSMVVDKVDKTYDSDLFAAQNKKKSAHTVIEPIVFVSSLTEQDNGTLCVEPEAQVLRWCFTMIASSSRLSKQQL